MAKIEAIKVPALGESVTEATISKWLKAEGETVGADEALVELETDKVTLEVASPITGVLSKVEVVEGDTVIIGQTLGKVEEGGTVKKVNKAANTTSSSQEKLVPTTSMAKSTNESTVADNILTLESLSPAVKRLVEENNLDPSTITGTGKDGRLTKSDVIQFINSSSTATTVVNNALPQSAKIISPEISNQREERKRMTRLRQRIAERLKEAQNTAAILTTFNEVDMSAIIALRKQHKESFQKKHNVKLGFMSFFVKAAVQALQEIPAVNAEIDGTDIIYKNYYDIGVAVSAPQGLVVPVVRNADTLSFAGIEKAITELGIKAREGQLSMAELTGGTFTVSNGGVFGSLVSTPILNPPQSGILGMHKTQERPVAINGQVEIRPMMYLALSYDHRIVDGKEAVTFLVRVKESLEDPERLVLDL